MTKQYGRRAFEEILSAGSDEGIDVLHDRWLQVEDDGIYLRSPTQQERQLFSREELAAMRPRHPAGNPDAPALPFPFNIRDLISFEKEMQLICAMFLDLDGERVTEQLDDEPKALIEQLLDAMERSKKNGTAPRKVPRQRAQEDEILVAIRSLGNDPIRLPRPSPGRRGIKAEVRRIVLENRPKLFSLKTFDLAWERLRARGEIKDDDSAPPSG